MENNEPNNEIIIYQGDSGESKIEVRLIEETVWLSQQQLAELYQSSRTNIVEHIKHIYNEGELDESATCRKFRQVRTEGGRTVEREILKRGSITDDKVKAYKSKMFAEKSLSNPYLDLVSASNGQRHRRYIVLGELQDQPVEGEFDQFGLSKTSTVPWF